ncbi:MAG: sulfatase family protein [Gemmataceae bacterium]
MLPLLLLLTFAAPARPNFVVLLADDLGYGDLRQNGNDAIKTPNLDRLAGGGLVLTQCYASAPVCSPSRTGMLTGQHPYRHGVRDWIPPNSGIFVPKTAPSVARLLADAGYRTCHAGKWHLNSKMDGTEPTPGDHGFQHWFATQNNAAPTHEDPVNFVRNGKKVGPLKGNSSHLIVREAVEWLDRLKPGEPFLLFVWFHAPHERVAVGPDWTAPYAAVGPEDRRQYYGSITLLDDAVGRLLAALDRKEVRDDTVVLFTSDNGPETLNRYKTANRSYGSPGGLRGMKLHLTEAGIRVPGTVSWPGRVKPGRSAVPVSNVDVLPTFCELAGVKRPAAPLDGTSVVPLLSGKPVERAVPLYWQYDRALGGFTHAVRVGDRKLLADAKREKVALYDLAADPGEKADRAEDEPAAVKELLAAMKERQDAVAAGR